MNHSYNWYDIWIELGKPLASNDIEHLVNWNKITALPYTFNNLPPKFAIFTLDWFE